MLKKVDMCGITSTELKWLFSYLRGRKQVVKFHQKTSEVCDITCGVPQGSVLGPTLFLLFINDISNFAVEACVLNMYAEDVIIHTSATSKYELECRLRFCIDNNSNWYSMNKLWINKQKSNVMVIGSKWQLKSLNSDDFTISVASDKLFLARQARYLGLLVRNDLSWDDHILELCRKMYYYFHMFRRLRKILPSALLLNIYKAYLQWNVDYGLSIWGCTTEVNLDHVQNFLARIIYNNFDYIHSRGIDLVRSLKLQTIRERRDHFLCVLLFKCIHGLAHQAYRVYSSFYMYAYINANILLTASPIYSYPELISIFSWYCYFYVWFIFMKVYICVPYIYVFYFVTGYHVRTV